MPTFNELTYFDLAVAGIFLLFLVRGAWIGFMRQLAAFFALVGSYFLAGQYAAAFTPLTERFVDNPKLTFILTFVVLFLLAAVAFTLIGKVLHRVMQITLLGWFDRLLGLALGALKALVLASLLYMVLASSLSTTNDLLRRSWSAPMLKQGAAVLQALINDPRLRQYFQHKEPAILHDLLPKKTGRETPPVQGGPQPVGQ
jgi:membrane protein required for colicin V production